MFPGAVGGGNWNGVTYNKKHGLIITNVMNAGQWGHLEECQQSRGPRRSRWRTRRRLTVLRVEAQPPGGGPRWRTGREENGPRVAVPQGHARGRPVLGAGDCAIRATSRHGAN